MIAVRRIGQIVKKDVRHLWPQILLFLTMLVVFACEDPEYVFHRSTGLRDLAKFLYVILPLSFWLLLTWLVQEERPLGDRQYWLTRPFTLVDLLAAKALFTGVFVIAPVLLCQFAALAALGLSPSHQVGGLMMKQIFFIAWLVLPVAAIAAMTKDLAQAFLVSLVILLGAAAAVAAIASSTWNDLNWMRETAAAAVMLCGAAAILYLVYTRRTVKAGAFALAIAVALVATILALPPLHSGFVFQSWLPQRTIDRRTIQISINPQPVLRRKWVDEGRRTIRIGVPLRWENVPADLAIHLEWIRIESPWKSAWFRPVDSIPEDWLTFELPGSTFQRLKQDTIRVRGSFGLILSATFSEVGSFGRCRNDSCEQYCFSDPRSSAPFPTSPWFSPIIYDGNDECPVPAVYPVAHIERSFDLGPLRLADYLEKK